MGGRLLVPCFLIPLLSSHQPFQGSETECNVGTVSQTVCRNRFCSKEREQYKSKQNFQHVSSLYTQLLQDSHPSIFMHVVNREGLNLAFMFHSDFPPTPSPGNFNSPGGMPTPVTRNRSFQDSGGFTRRSLE